MSYEVRLTKTAQKIYEKLPAKLQAGVDRCFLQLEADPRRSPNIQKLQGSYADYRCRVGGWRILYEINKDIGIVTVYHISPRGDAY